MPAEKSVSQGAATSVWAATAPELDLFGGEYLADCRVSAQRAKRTADPANATRLWAMTEKLVGQEFSFRAP
jgi:hypothetical protein